MLNAFNALIIPKLQEEKKEIEKIKQLIDDAGSRKAKSTNGMTRQEKQAYVANVMIPEILKHKEKINEHLNNMPYMKHYDYQVY